MRVASTTRGFSSPMNYVQGAGEFDLLGQYTYEYSKHALIVIDGFLFEDLNARLQKIYKDSPATFFALKFGGECCQDECERLSQAAHAGNAGVLVGIGGGKTMDTVKLVADGLSLPLIIVPTSASTDAPTSSMSVVYSNEGVYLKNVQHKNHASLVLLDSDIIAKAPLRLFVAGMGDALATYFEALANERADAPNLIGKGYRRCKASLALSKLCYEILMQDGRNAKMALECGARTEAVENVIEANTLLSGLGFENAGLACAHGIHSGLTVLPETHKYLHGEKVAFGLICQLVLENAPSGLVEQVLHFMQDVGLPCTLKELGVAPTQENIRKIAHQTACVNTLIQAQPFFIDEDLVFNAIIAADALGCKYKSNIRTD